MRCFYCQDLNEKYANLCDSDRKHLFSVLRAKENSRILLINGEGGTAEGVIESNRVVAISSYKQYPSPRVKVHLFVVPPRKQKMDLLLSQCAEAGVWEIHTLFTENSVALPQKEATIERWRLKLIEACKQSHNPFVPRIYSPTTLTVALNDIAKSKFLAFFGSTDLNKKNVFQSSLHGEVAWMVGPEGGFTSKETRLMIDAGCSGITIGRCIMRVETAAVVGTALLQL